LYRAFSCAAAHTVRLPLGPTLYRRSQALFGFGGDRVAALPPAAGAGADPCRRRRESVTRISSLLQHVRHRSAPSLVVRRLMAVDGPHRNGGEREGKTRPRAPLARARRRRGRGVAPRLDGGDGSLGRRARPPRAGVSGAGALVTDLRPRPGGVLD